MLYLHHGLAACDFFDVAAVDVDALIYLSLACQVAEVPNICFSISESCHIAPLTHYRTNFLAPTRFQLVRPGAVVIAEEVSGWPGLCRARRDGGVGFGLRLAMAVPDMWIRLLKVRPLWWEKR